VLSVGAKVGNLWGTVILITEAISLVSVKMN